MRKYVLATSLLRLFLPVGTVQIVAHRNEGYTYTLLIHQKRVSFEEKEERNPISCVSSVLCTFTGMVTHTVSTTSHVTRATSPAPPPSPTPEHTDAAKICDGVPGGKSALIGTRNGCVMRGVGLNEDMIKKYIRNQEESDRLGTDN